MKMAMNEMTEKRYYGKVCDRHPEFNGLRLKRGYECVQCRSNKKKGIPRGAKPDIEAKIESIKHQIDALDRKRVLLINELRQECEKLEAEKDLI